MRRPFEVLPVDVVRGAYTQCHPVAMYVPESSLVALRRTGVSRAIKEGRSVMLSYMFA